MHPLNCVPLQKPFVQALCASPVDKCSVCRCKCAGASVPVQVCRSKHLLCQYIHSYWFAYLIAAAFPFLRVR